MFLSPFLKLEISYFQSSVEIKSQETSEIFICCNFFNFPFRLKDHGRKMKPVEREIYERIIRAARKQAYSSRYDK